MSETGKQWEKYGTRTINDVTNLLAKTSMNIVFAENPCHIRRKMCGDYALYSRKAGLADISVGHCKAG